MAVLAGRGHFDSPNTPLGRAEFPPPPAAVMMPAMVVEDDVSRWVGREQTSRDRVALTPVRCLHALLDRPGPEPVEGDVLPWGWHWLWSFNQRPAPQAQIDVDGHAPRGAFLPPVALPRRMWAGSRIAFAGAPLCVGQVFECRSRIAAVQPKGGRSGALVFVTVEHHWTGPDGPALVEWQDIVYREAAAPGAAASTGARAVAPERPAQVRRAVMPSATALFRYSALTFNAHRIHYDRAYARDAEGYPGLVVHGPLQATLLLDLLARHAGRRALAHFEFRGLAPLCDTGPFAACAAGLDDPETVLWTESPDGGVATHAVACWR